MKIRKLIIALTSMAVLLIVAVPFGVAQEVEKSEVVGISGAMGFVVEWIEPDSPTEKAGMKGFIVESVKSGSPAEKAGIKRGDAIMSLDGRRVQSIQDIEYAFSNSLNNPNEQIAGVYLRYEPMTGRHVIIRTEQMTASMTKPITGGVLDEKATEKPLPTYPLVAKAAQASGAVAVRVIVNDEGRVTKAEAISGHPLLQAAAVEAAYHARFSPTKLSGTSVKVSGVLTYNFTLP
jgi:TonB family protein